MGGLIHVGAWDGREYLADGRRLLLFEPQAEAFGRLRANFRGRDNVKVVNVAIGSRSGEATMHTASPSHSSSLLPPRTHSGNPIQFGGTETVQVKTLDEAIGEREGFDGLRIDTQGYELEVLKGATETLKGIKRIEVEFHNPRTYPGAPSLKDVDDYLFPLGFTRTGWDTQNSDDVGDAIYERSE